MKFSCEFIHTNLGLSTPYLSILESTVRLASHLLITAHNSTVQLTNSVTVYKMMSKVIWKASVIELAC